MQPETKRKILISICWALAVVALAAGAWFFYNWSQLSTYRDAQFRFSIRYPSKWQKVDRFQGTAVAFIRPKQTAMDTVLANVNISIQDVPDKIATLESFSQKITQQLGAVYKKSIKIVEDREFTFAGRRGHRIVFESPQPDDLKLMIVWTIKGSYAYIFTFLSKVNQYKELSPTIDQMVDSFQFN